MRHTCDYICMILCVSMCVRVCACVPPVSHNTGKIDFSIQNACVIVYFLPSERNMWQRRVWHMET